MKEITLKSYAKVNLSLDVLGIMANGYHIVEMVMQLLELHDSVSVSWQEYGDERVAEKQPEILISSNRKDVPLGQGNLAYKAARLMLERTGKNGIIKIHIEKRIPIAAGLAGGSGNGGAVLLALNELFGRIYTLQQLCEMGVKLGADVPFCMMGQAKRNEVLGDYMNNDSLACTCALAEGIGEILTPLPPLEAEVLLSKPPIGISTAEAYKGIDEIMGFVKPVAETETVRKPNTNINAVERTANLTHHIETKELISGLHTGNHGKVTDNMANILELFSVKRYSDIMYTKDKIQEQGWADKILMSGSGPTVFAVYFNRGKMEEDYMILKELNQETFFTKTLL